MTNRVLILAVLFLSLTITISAGAQVIAPKAGVTEVKTGMGKISKAKPEDFQPAIERFKEAIPQSGPKVGKSDQGSKILEWARSEQTLQVFHRPEADVYTDLSRGVVAVSPRAKDGKLPSAKAGESPDETALRYIAENESVFGLKAPKSELAEVRRQEDELGMTHIFFRQEYAGIPLWGRDLAVHIDATGNLNWVNCFIQPSPRGLDTQPTISGEEAIRVASVFLQDQGITIALGPEEAARLGFGPPTAELYYREGSYTAGMELTWMVEIRPNVQDWMRFFVRANDGEIVDHYNATNFDGPATAEAVNIAGRTVTLHTYLLEGKYRMMDSTRSMFVQGQTAENLKNDPQGVIWTLDLRGQDLKEGSTIYFVLSDDNTWPDPITVSAQNYSELIYEYYLNTHNRNSFNSEGKSMMALVNVAQNGQPMDNAFWNGSFVSLGAGKTNTTHWAGALDFVAHEFTHAHVQYTAGLEYKFQSGALNETYADIGGVSLDNEDYKMGEDIVVTQYFPSGAMRDLANPHNGGSGTADLQSGWQPAHMNEYLNLTLEQDNGGVHINSGITNFAAYKILVGLGREKGEKVLYRALFNYLGKQSNFTDFRIAAIKAATDLYAEADVNVVKTAFDQVGIVEGTGTEPPEDRPTVAGSQRILIVNEFDTDYWVEDNSLMITNPFSTPTEITSLTYINQNYTQVNVRSGRPIAVDPYGQAIFFVTSTYLLHGVNPANGAEQIIDANPNWWSIAVSPSGQRVAMTKNLNENIIYVIDLKGDQQFHPLTLKHPTTDHSNQYADIVNFADSLVFIDDNLLAYDSSNSVQSPGQGTMTFWDVNVIDVTNGQIFSLLPPQQSGVHVINPTIASTNNTILCVEVYQEGVGNQIVGINLVTGEGKTIVNNGLDLGFPDYSPNDGTLLFTRTNVNSYQDIYAVDLAEDKITPSGEPIQAFVNCQLPTWFASGTPPTAYVGFQATASSGDETVTTVNIPVTLTEASGDAVTVDYAVTGGNAIGSGQDYTLDSGRLTFEPSQTTKNIVMTVVDDGIEEPDETVTITLSRPVNVWLGQNTAHTYTIIDTGGAASTNTPEPPTSTPTITHTLQPATATPTITQTLQPATSTPTITNTMQTTATPTNTARPIDPDVNGDGKVDGKDVLELAAALRTGDTDEKYDVDGNGDVDYMDLLTLSLFWKQGSQPEPTPTRTSTATQRPTATNTQPAPPTATSTPVSGTAEAEPNNTENTAQTLGALNVGGSVALTGSLSSGGMAQNNYTGDLDYYSFTLPAQAQLSLTFDWTGPADVDLALGSQGLILNSLTGAEKPIQVVGTLSQGTFFLVTASKDQAANYTLSITATAPNASYANDNSLLNGDYYQDTGGGLINFYRFDGNGSYGDYSWNPLSGEYLNESGSYTVWYPYLILDPSGAGKTKVFEMEITSSTVVYLDGTKYAK